MGMGEVKAWTKGYGVRKRLNHRAQDAHVGSSIDRGIALCSVSTAPSTELTETIRKKRRRSSLGYIGRRAQSIIGRSQLGQEGTRHQ